MFDVDVVLGACQVLADPAAPPLDRLKAGVALVVAGDAAQAQAAADLAGQAG